MAQRSMFSGSIFHLGKSLLLSWISGSLMQSIWEPFIHLISTCHLGCTLIVKLIMETMKNIMTFLLGFLLKRNFLPLRHLTLKCCNLTPSCSFDGLVSLKSLALDIVTLTGSFLKDMPSHGLELEQLSLKRLRMDRDCKLNIDLSKLKYLAIVDCERLRGININGAVELNEFFFAGKHEYCSFKNVPKLVNVSFNCNTDDDYDGVLNVLTKFGHRLPQLEILNLHRRTPYVSESLHKYYIYIFYNTTKT